jgi:hypothetical protein
MVRAACGTNQRLRHAYPYVRLRDTSRKRKIKNKWMKLMLLDVAVAC